MNIYVKYANFSYFNLDNPHSMHKDFVHGDSISSQDDSFGHHNLILVELTLN